MLLHLLTKSKRLKQIGSLVSTENIISQRFLTPVAIVFAQNVRLFFDHIKATCEN
jgi:hypothetical protein